MAQDREDIREAVRQDKEAKERQKRYKDDKKYVQPHSIKVGDKVLLERKVTKTQTPYDPAHYTVTSTHGTQITGRRGEVEEKTRDAQKWKKVRPGSSRDYDKIRAALNRPEIQADYYPDIGPATNSGGSPVQEVAAAEGPAVRPHRGKEAERAARQEAAGGRPSRTRRPIERYQAGGSTPAGTGQQHSTPRTEGRSRYSRQQSREESADWIRLQSGQWHNRTRDWSK